MYPCNNGPFSGVSQHFENELDDLKEDNINEEKLQGSRPQCSGPNFGKPNLQNICKYQTEDL